MKVYWDWWRPFSCICASVIFVMAGGCCEVVPPGHVGIKVNNYGNNRGVESYPIQTGAVWYNPITTRVFSYPTSIITAIWTKDTTEGKPVDESITFNTSEGTSISGDVSLSFSLNPDSVPNFYVKFRNDDVQQFLHGYLHNVARDALNEIASKYALEDLYGSKKEEFLNHVKARINNDIGRYGSISQFGFTGALRMDPRIVDALNNKLKAVQDAITAENQLRQTEADARKLVAQKAGEAEANNKLAQSISPNLLEWKRLEISEICAQKWDGKQPEFLSGAGNNLLMQLPAPK